MTGTYSERHLDPAQALAYRGKFERTALRRLSHRRERSIVREMEPVDWREVWRYAGTPERPLYSRFCGAAQRLANGNTLITETDGGRALEVDAQGTIVWEFFNPRRAGAEGGFIAAISEMERVPEDATAGWLK